VISQKSLGLSFLKKKLMETETKRERLWKTIVNEFERACVKHPNPFHSRHEGFAVLLEEVDELKDAIWHDRSIEEVREEVVQVAAMALRFLLDISK